MQIIFLFKFITISLASNPAIPCNVVERSNESPDLGIKPMTNEPHIPLQSVETDNPLIIKDFNELPPYSSVNDLNSTMNVPITSETEMAQTTHNNTNFDTHGHQIPDSFPEEISEPVNGVEACQIDNGGCCVCSGFFDPCLNFISKAYNDITKCFSEFFNCRNCNCSNRNNSGCNCSGCDFSGCDCSGACEGCDCSGCDCGGGDCSGAGEGCGLCVFCGAWCAQCVSSGGS